MVGCVSPQQNQEKKRNAAAAAAADNNKILFKPTIGIPEPWWNTNNLIFETLQNKEKQKQKQKRNIMVPAVQPSLHQLDISDVLWNHLFPNNPRPQQQQQQQEKQQNNRIQQEKRESLITIAPWLQDQSCPWGSSWSKEVWGCVKA
ncbi:unnamed protein product [Cercospora beticola]|nr:unnamed protein product [Cercospora beticola]